MSLTDVLKRNPDLTVKDFQEFQRRYDEKFVSDEFIGFDKVRHTYAHIGKTVGRLAEYIQQVEDGNTEFSANDVMYKVIPDLLVYSLWLAEEFEVNVERTYLNRIVGNIVRLHSSKISSEEFEELEDFVAKRFESML